MDAENILKLADIISDLPQSFYSDNFGFNQNFYVHECGSPSCIAGWAAQQSTGDAAIYTTPSDRRQVACRWLGLENDHRELFYPPLELAWHLITPAQAAETLRKLAQTGVVDWSHVFEGSVQ